MRLQRTLKYTTSLAIAILTTGIFADLVKEDCLKLIRHESGHCCMPNSNSSIVERNLKCYDIIIKTKVSSSEELQDVLQCFMRHLSSVVSGLRQENKVIYKKVLPRIKKGLKPGFLDFPDSEKRHCYSEAYYIMETFECKSNTEQISVCLDLDDIEVSIFKLSE
ncbi:unnamed protein product [Nezara viridula]|uniref:Uncharacterized protein n=1 Tax=Nezara viridula TaxID=85310 RepID=A0A9P0MUG5_NEZVI|nr:unnamed protein product [Nezara viridula]